LSVNPKQRGTLSEQIFSQLAKRIRECDIAPGQMMTESELATYYSVSKTPVREALYRLVQMGLVEKYAHKGYYVKGIDIGDVFDGYHVRTLLETDAAALAATRITEEELDRLETILEGLTDSDKGSMDLNRQFHLTIAQASKNKRLADIIRIAYDDLHRLFMMDPYLIDWEETGIEEHRRIFRALKAGDSEEARRATKEHMEAGVTRIMQNRFRRP